jgi:hypothetical protein
MITFMPLLPDELVVYPDRGMIGFYGDHVDTFDPALASRSRNGVLLANDHECYLHTEQSLEPVTLHFTTGAPSSTPLGTALLEVPTGGLIVSEITRGAHGPFELSAGPGIYRLRVDACQAGGQSTAPALTSAGERGTERYWVTVEKTADLPGDC